MTMRASCRLCGELKCQSVCPAFTAAGQHRGAKAIPRGQFLVPQPCSFAYRLLHCDLLLQGPPAKIAQIIFAHVLSPRYSAGTDCLGFPSSSPRMIANVKNARIP